MLPSMIPHVPTGGTLHQDDLLRAESLVGEQKHGQLHAALASVAAESGCLESSQLLVMLWGLLSVKVWATLGYSCLIVSATFNKLWATFRLWYSGLTSWDTLNQLWTSGYTWRS